MVTSSSPAQIGETLLVYLTGLGQVDSGGNPTNPITASIGGVPATIQFAGTGSAEGGAYQMNVTVPGRDQSGNRLSFYLGAGLPQRIDAAADRHICRSLVNIERSFCRLSGIRSLLAKVIRFTGARNLEL